MFPCPKLYIQYIISLNHFFIYLFQSLPSSPILPPKSILIKLLKMCIICPVHDMAFWLRPKPPQNYVSIEYWSDESKNNVLSWWISVLRWNNEQKALDLTEEDQGSNPAASRTVILGKLLDLSWVTNDRKIHILSIRQSGHETRVIMDIIIATLLTVDLA